jgi:hypothetical protein
MDTPSGFSLLKTCVNDMLKNKMATQLVKTNLAFEDFKKHTEEQKLYNQFLVEEYMKNHHIPRKEQEFAYNIYTADKGRLKTTWQESKDIGKLNEYLQFKIPDPVLLPKDDIYTIYTPQYRYVEPEPIPASTTGGDASITSNISQIQ